MDKMIFDHHLSLINFIEIFRGYDCVKGETKQKHYGDS